MPVHTPKICIEGKFIEFITAKFDSRGFNTASQLTFTSFGFCAPGWLPWQIIEEIFTFLTVQALCVMSTFTLTIHLER